MKKLTKALFIIVIGLVFIFVALYANGRLFFKMGQDNVIIDRNGLKPVYSEVLSDEVIEIDNIKKLDISCDLTDIEIEENKDSQFTLEIINIDSKEASKIEYSNNNQEISIVNQSLKNKTVGTFDENSTRYKVVLKGPIHDIEEVSVKNSVGSIVIDGVQTENLFVESYASSLEINDSILKDFKSSIVFSDVYMQSSKVTDLNMDIEASRIFGGNLELCGVNVMKASKVTGQLGVDNYKDVAIGKKVATSKALLDIDGKISKIDVIDENNFYNEGD